jgi:hypothetical protein
LDWLASAIWSFEHVILLSSVVKHKSNSSTPCVTPIARDFACTTGLCMYNRKIF